MNAEEKSIWFSETPRHWKFKRVKAIITANDGGVWGDDPYDDNGVGVLRSNEITKDGAWAITDPAIRSLSKNEASSRRLKAGDLVIVKSSGSEIHIGKTALVDSSVAEMNYCFSNFTQRLTPTKHHLNSRYLWYILNNAPGRDQLFYFGTTTTGLINLSGSNLGRVIIPLPPLPEQKRIAAYLDASCAAIDRAVETKQKQLETLDALRKSIIQSAVTQGLNPKVKMKESGVDWLGRVPEHWRRKVIKRVCKFSPRCSHEKPGEEEMCTVVPMASVSVTGEIDCSGIKPMAEIIPGLNLIENGDVIFAKITPCMENGKGAFVQNLATRYAFGSTEFHVMRPSHEILGEYLYFYLHNKVFRNWAEKNMHGAAGQQRVGATFLKYTCICVPEQSEQAAIVTFLRRRLEEIVKIEENVSSQIATLTAYRKSLIHECVTGKRRISDADVSMVEAHV